MSDVSELSHNRIPSLFGVRGGSRSSSAYVSYQ
jgi:hypothetical protein